MPRLDPSRDPSREIACPFCGAAIGRACITKGGATLFRGHVQRVKAARRAMGLEAWQSAQRHPFGRNRFLLRRGTKG